ncbi:MAG TPA: hypothetical protein VF630_03960 [Hymenobacter sp.]|jgi:hypothetical protein
MKKNKKNKTGKKKSLFSGTAKSLKKLGTGFGGLSTVQKVAGGAALVALGLNYWNKRRNKTTASEAPTTPDASAAEESLAAMDGNA